MDQNQDHGFFIKERERIKIIKALKTKEKGQSSTILNKIL